MRSRRSNGRENGGCKIRNGAGVDGRNKRTKNTARQISTLTVKTSLRNFSGIKNRPMVRYYETPPFSQGCLVAQACTRSTL